MISHNNFIAIIFIIENEKNKAISESKAANESLDKLHVDLAFLEKQLQEEKENRLKLLSLSYEKSLQQGTKSFLCIIIFTLCGNLYK